jgi:hypothetical protein
MWVLVVKAGFKAFHIEMCFSCGCAKRIPPGCVSKDREVFRCHDTNIDGISQGL